MKRLSLPSALALFPLILLAQNGGDPAEPDLSEVVVIDASTPSDTPEDDARGGASDTAAPSAPDASDEAAPPAPDAGDGAAGNSAEGAEATVVEIEDAPIEGAAIDDSADVIPEMESDLPEDTEVVLELPGQEDRQGGGATVADEETISVDFPDEDVRTILRSVADLFDLNLVIPDGLQGRTSIKLRNVSWRQVFEVVLEPLAYTYVEDRNIIRVKSIEDLTTEPVDTRVFVVNFAQAGELQGSIAPLVDEAAGGRIQVDTRSNALVVTERPSKMNKIQEIIERLDRATDQVMIESKFIEVTNTDVENIGVNWASLSGYSATAGPFQREWTRNRTKSDTASTSGGSTATSTTETDSGSIDGSPTPEVVTTEEAVGSTFEALSEVASSASTGRLDTALFSADQFELILSALETQDDIKLVSNPTVVTLNNTEAKIAIGERFPIPEYTFNAETGQRQLDEIRYEDIGINLDVTPQVNSAGFINLQIVPEVSSTDRFALIENTQIPIIESRRTESTIMIKDGFTLAIGGLVENNVAERGTKVPLLGDLPGVGRFFSSRSDEVSQRNLIIFITAKTLNPDGSTYRDIIDPRVLNQMGVIPSEVPGYEIPEDERAVLETMERLREETRRAERLGGVNQRIDQIRQTKQASEQSGAESASGAENAEPDAPLIGD